MIIIRTQDKETLGRYSEIKIDEHMIVGYEGANKITVLGAYKTRERAMQILDCIHNQIAKSVARDYLDGKYRVKQDFVYQMPVK